MLERHLAQAEHHVAQGEKNTARQRQIIAELERGGHDLKIAQDLLAHLESMQTSHIIDRDRLRAQLEAQASPRRSASRKRPPQS
jgi:uncharacterized protein HemY